MKNDDIELYQQWRAGDKLAGTQLVERHYDSIHRFFRTKAGPEADDLVQRTFLACADHERGFRGESSFRTYLFGVARNVLFEQFHARARDARIDPDFSVSSACELAPGPSTFVAERVEVRLLVEALRKLPLDIQITLELFYWEEMSVAELAEVLDIPAGTVKSRLFRGRTLLKEAIDGAATPPDAAASVRLLVADWANQLQLRIGASDPE